MEQRLVPFMKYFRSLAGIATWTNDDSDAFMVEGNAGLNVLVDDG